MRWVLKLLKGLYGLKQGSRIWWKTLMGVLTQMGFNVLECDPSVYIFERGDVKIIMPVHTDNCAVTAPSDEIVDAFITELRKHFDVKDLGPINKFLGIIIERDDEKLFLHQTPYIESILSEFMYQYDSDGKPLPLNSVQTPMLDCRLSRDDCPLKPEEIEAMKKFHTAKLLASSFISWLVHDPTSLTHSPSSAVLAKTLVRSIGLQ
jgi:hypothetical protein